MGQKQSPVRALSVNQQRFYKQNHSVTTSRLHSLAQSDADKLSALSKSSPVCSPEAGWGTYTTPAPNILLARRVCRGPRPFCTRSERILTAPQGKIQDKLASEREKWLGVGHVPQHRLSINHAKTMRLTSYHHHVLTTPKGTPETWQCPSCYPETT